MEYQGSAPVNSDQHIGNTALFQQIKQQSGEQPLWLKARECSTLIGLLKVFCDHVTSGFKTNFCIQTHAHVL